jgi:hypothetical protein
VTSPHMGKSRFYSDGPVLELVVDEEVVASAVRYLSGEGGEGGPGRHGEGLNVKGRDAEDSERGWGGRAEGGERQHVRHGGRGGAAVGVYSKEGRLIAWEMNGRLLVGEEAINKGAATHSVVRWGTPLVRHIHFLGHGEFYLSTDAFSLQPAMPLLPFMLLSIPVTFPMFLMLHLLLFILPSLP